MIAVPLLIERLALGRVPGVVRVGMGSRAVLPPGASPVVVVGVGGGLVPALRPGDLVVADEVRDADGAVPCATGIAAALRARGLTVHIGPIWTADHLVDGPERTELDALAVDTESAVLVRAAGDRPRAVVRAIADTPDRPLKSLHTVRGGIAALLSISRSAPALAEWAMSKEVG